MVKQPMSMFELLRRWFKKLPHDDAIPVGTRVHLKSGSPLMTVAGTNKDGSVGCYWIDGNNQYSMNAWKEMLDVKVGSPE